MIETRLSIRVGDLEEAIQGTYGSLEGFQESLRKKSENEPFSEVVYEALAQEKHTQDEVMDLRTVWYGDKMPPFGISQMEVLNEIMQEPPHSIRELAKRMGKNFETVREHVLLLESQGLVWVDRKGRGRRAPVHPVPTEFTVSITRPKKDETAMNLLSSINRRLHPAPGQAVDGRSGGTHTTIDAKKVDGEGKHVEDDAKPQRDTHHPNLAH